MRRSARAAEAGGTVGGTAFDPAPASSSPLGMTAPTRAQLENSAGVEAQLPTIRSLAMNGPVIQYYSDPAEASLERQGLKCPQEVNTCGAAGAAHHHAEIVGGCTETEKAASWDAREALFRLARDTRSNPKFGASREAGGLETATFARIAPRRAARAVVVYGLDSTAGVYELRVGALSLARVRLCGAAVDVRTVPGDIDAVAEVLWFV